MSGREREEVFNVLLAQCISERGMVAAPENIMTANGRRAMPDVIVSVRGLRCIIEGKMGDVQDARNEAATAAQRRIATGIAHIGVGVVYPAFLRESSFKNQKHILSTTTLEFIVCSEASPGAWEHGTLDSILDELRRAYDMLVRDDVLTRSVQRLQSGMGALTQVLSMYPAASTRLADTLGVYQKETDEGNDDDE